MDATHIHRLFSDDDAVSPVIGVILMVAITVILAAVIATFVLGLGQSVTESQAPTADFQFDYDGSDVTITHNGGDSITADRLTVTSTGSAGDITTAFESSGSSVTAGSSETISASSGDTIRVVWTSQSGASSQTLAEYTVE